MYYRTNNIQKEVRKKLSQEPNDNILLIPLGVFLTMRDPLVDQVLERTRYDIKIVTNTSDDINDIKRKKKQSFQWTCNNIN